MKPRKTVAMLTFWGMGVSAAEALGPAQVRNRKPQVVSKGSVRTRRDCGVVTRDELIGICTRAKDSVIGLVARKTDSNRKFLEVRFVPLDPQKSRTGIVHRAQLMDFLAQVPDQVKIVRAYDNLGRPNFILDLKAEVTGQEEVITLRRARMPKQKAAAG